MKQIFISLNISDYVVPVFQSKVPIGWTRKDILFQEKINSIKCVSILEIKIKPCKLLVLIDLKLKLIVIEK